MSPPSLIVTITTMLYCNGCGRSFGPHGYSQHVRRTANPLCLAAHHEQVMVAQLDAGLVVDVADVLTGENEEGDHDQDEGDHDQDEGDQDEGEEDEGEEGKNLVLDTILDSEPFVRAC